MSAPKLPAPTSGPSVVSYLVLCVMVAVAVLLVLYLLGAAMPGTLHGFRAALGLRPS